MLRYETNATPFCSINYYGSGNCYQLQAQQGLGYQRQERKKGQG